jgi:hypothetical protein
MTVPGSRAATPSSRLQKVERIKKGWLSVPEWSDLRSPASPLLSMLAAPGGGPSVSSVKSSAREGP